MFNIQFELERLGISSGCCGPCSRGLEPRSTKRPTWNPGCSRVAMTQQPQLPHASHLDIKPQKQKFEYSESNSRCEDGLYN